MSSDSVTQEFAALVLQSSFRALFEDQKTVYHMSSEALRHERSISRQDETLYHLPYSRPDATNCKGRQWEQVSVSFGSVPRKSVVVPQIRIRSRSGFDDLWCDSCI